MLAVERRGQILEAAERNGFVRVTDLVRALSVSEVTIRRDLEVLVEQGLVEKVHGGARKREDASHPASTPGATAGRDPVHIGLLLPSGADYFRRIVDGVQSVATRLGCQLSMSVSQYHPDREEGLTRGLLDSGVQGLLLVPSVTDGSERGRWLFDLGVPAVLIERELNQLRLGDLSSVRTAHERGAAQAVHHLHGLGHERIALITRGDSQVADLVREGWRSAVEELSLPLDVPIVSGKDVGSWPRWEEVDVEKIVQALQQSRVTALVCHNDENALAIMDHARGIGWSVPDDLSVVAYEDEIAQLASPPLTAVSPPKEEVGATSANLLLELIAKPDQSPRHITIEPQLILRDSTAIRRHSRGSS